MAYQLMLRWFFYAIIKLRHQAPWECWFFTVQLSFYRRQMDNNKDTVLVAVRIGTNFKREGSHWCKHRGNFIFWTFWGKVAASFDCSTLENWAMRELGQVCLSIILQSSVLDRQNIYIVTVSFMEICLGCLPSLLI